MASSTNRNRISLNTELTCEHDSSIGSHQRTLSGSGVVTSTYVIEHWEEPDVWIRCRLVRPIDDHSVEIAVMSIDEFEEVDPQTYRLTSRLKVGVTTSDADGTRHEPLPVAS